MSTTVEELEAKAKAAAKQARAARAEKAARDDLAEAIDDRARAEDRLLAALDKAHRAGVPKGVMAEMLGLSRQGFRNLQDRLGLR